MPKPSSHSLAISLRAGPRSSLRFWALRWCSPRRAAPKSASPHLRVARRHHELRPAPAVAEIVPRGALLARLNFRTLSLAVAASVVTRLGVGVILIELGMGLNGAVLATVLSQLVVTALIVWPVRHELRRVPETTPIKVPLSDATLASIALAGSPPSTRSTRCSPGTTCRRCSPATMSRRRRQHRLRSRFGDDRVLMAYHDSWWWRRTAMAIRS